MDRGQKIPFAGQRLADQAYRITKRQRAEIESSNYLSDEIKRELMREVTDRLRLIDHARQQTILL